MGASILKSILVSIALARADSPARVEVGENVQMNPPVVDYPHTMKEMWLVWLKEEKKACGWRTCVANWGDDTVEYYVGVTANCQKDIENVQSRPIAFENIDLRTGIKKLDLWTPHRNKTELIVSPIGECAAYYATPGSEFACKEQKMSTNDIDWGRSSDCAPLFMNLTTVAETPCKWRKCVNTLYQDRIFTHPHIPRVYFGVAETCWTELPDDVVQIQRFVDDDDDDKEELEEPALIISPINRCTWEWAHPDTVYECTGPGLATDEVNWGSRESCAKPIYGLEGMWNTSGSAFVF